MVDPPPALRQAQMGRALRARIHLAESGVPVLQIIAFFTSSAVSPTSHAKAPESKRPPTPSTPGHPTVRHPTKVKSSATPISPGPTGRSPKAVATPTTTAQSPTPSTPTSRIGGWLSKEDPRPARRVERIVSHNLPRRPGLRNGRKHTGPRHITNAQHPRELLTSATWDSNLRIASGIQIEAKTLVRKIAPATTHPYPAKIPIDWLQLQSSCS